MKKDRLASSTNQDPKVEIESQLRQLLGQVMRESGELHRLILSSISEIVFITDNSGVLTFVSPNVKETFGYSSYEIQELENITQLLGDNLFRWQDLHTSEQISNIEREIIDKAGRRRTTAVASDNDPMPTGAFVPMEMDFYSSNHPIRLKAS